jgi:hypothetical protein
VIVPAAAFRAVEDQVYADMTRKHGASSVFRY